MRITKLLSITIAAALCALMAACATGETPWPDTGTTDTAIEPGFDTGYDINPDTLYDPGTDPGTDPGMDPGYDPGTDPGYDPGCPETPCGLLPNCGCDPGQKCYVDVSSTPFVRRCTTAGSGTSSSLCTREEDCAIETQCIVLFGDSTSPESMCYDYCNSDSDCPSDASICLSYYTAEIHPMVCSHQCDPIRNTGCPSGTKCQLLVLTTSGESLTDCTADLGYTPAGGTCTVEEDCAGGTFCATTIGTCIQMCSWPTGSECGVMETCTPFEDDTGGYVVLDGVTYGYCV